MKEFTVKALAIILISILISLNGYSQKEFNAREFFIEAESYFLFEEYKEALPLYQRILRVEQDNYNVMYKIGICYLNDPYQKERSVKYLLDASKSINYKYKNNSYKEKQAPADVLYFLGQAYRVTGSLDKAIEQYNQFKSSVDPAVYNFDVVNAELASCEVAKTQKKSPVYINSKNLGEVVNTKFAEVMPILSGDGKTIIFTRNLQFYDAIFISTLDDKGNWSSPYNLTPDFGLDGNSYTTGISYYGDEIFVYRSDNFDGNIYSSKKDEDRWQALEKLNEHVNTKYWESHASISADGQHLFFTSNRKGGYGGLDIYRSTRNSKGDWDQAVNLGPVINSTYNEDTPFISPVDNKLYFSSLGHNGMGGYDIFVSERKSYGKWTKPVNMGYPFNTTDDDLFFCPVDVDGYTGIQSAYIEESTYGLKDVYWVEVYNDILPRTFSVSGQVNAPTEDLLKNGNIKISLIDNSAGKIISQVEVDSTGVFELAASQGEYQLLVDGEGIKPVSVPVSLTLNQENQAVELALITALAAAVGEDVMVVPPSKLPQLTVIGDDYVLVDTTPVTINLDVEKGSELKVETYGGNNLANTEEYHLTKSKFAYLFVPIPGENKVIFTITDSRGNVNTKEVIIYYTPKEEESITEVIPEMEIKETNVSGVAVLAGLGLQQYLLGLGDVNFTSKSDLYTLLMANADSNGYTEDDVNQFFALVLTQRDKDEFVEEMDNTPEFDDKKLSDSLMEELDYPLSIVYETKGEYNKTTKEINDGLISMVPYSGVPASELAYILSFSTTALPADIDYSDLYDDEYQSELLTILSSGGTDTVINLASTTQALEFYYQNLLASTDGAIKEMLTDIDFEKENINNSIDLVQYMLENAHKYDIESAELIAVLENAQNSQKRNLYEFKESLALAATGQLKTAIEEIDIENAGIVEFEQILSRLLDQARLSGYSPSEVYELLLSLLGIDNATDLASAMAIKSVGQLDSLIKTLDMQQFSKPVELIQYLLSQAAYFDYTDSDINNLLLRMLLEKGIDNFQQTEAIQHAEKLVKRKRVVTTIVLANALIIILLLIFWRRSKKK